MRYRVIAKLNNGQQFHWDFPGNETAAVDRMKEISLRGFGIKMKSGWRKWCLVRHIKSLRMIVLREAA